jgi:23S rRNA pseudouridine1911/1915/1917 synthase
MTKELIAKQEIRLDKYLSEELNQTRNQIIHLIKKGFVEVENKKVAKTGLKLKLNQKISVTLPTTIKKEAMEVDFEIEVIYEDEDILVIDKPTGVIVHDAPSVHEATLVDWLKEKGISLSTISGEERHGIVHRLDKGTSGLLVIAKNNEAHVNLSSQLEDKSMGRYYIAISDIALKDDIVVDKPIYRSPNNRLKMAVVPNGKNAKTAFKKLIISNKEQANQKKYEVIAAKLFTGRTHQIRVHLESISRHILGDTLYGFKGNEDNISRIYLHAYCLYLMHPRTNEAMSFVSNIPDDMTKLMQNNFDEEIINEKINKEYITNSFSDIDQWM